MKAYATNPPTSATSSPNSVGYTLTPALQVTDKGVVKARDRHLEIEAYGAHKRYYIPLRLPSGWHYLRPATAGNLRTVIWRAWDVAMAL
ncbi:MAG: hypothetical protein ACLU5K_05845 [Christensenellales bacterium]